MDHSLGTLLMQKNDEGLEQAIYYLSQTLIGADCRTTQSKMNALLSFLPSKIHDITWLGKPFMSFLESIF